MQMKTHEVFIRGMCGFVTGMAHQGNQGLLPFDRLNEE
jgi:hypothetical protein